MASEREKIFVEAYALAVCFMRLAQYNLERASAFTDGSYFKLKHTLDKNAQQMGVRIVDVTLKLNATARKELMEDLNKDHFQAMGSIMHELLQATNLLEEEDDIISFLKERLTQTEWVPGE